MANKIFSQEKLHIQLSQIQQPIETNTISPVEKYLIEILPDLICAVHLDTIRQFVASVFDKPLVLRNSIILSY